MAGAAPAAGGAGGAERVLWPWVPPGTDATDGRASGGGG